MLASENSRARADMDHSFADDRMERASVMVLFTLTPAMVAAVKEYRALSPAPPDLSTTEAPLDDPQAGKPISHGQIIDIHRKLKEEGFTRKISDNGKPQAAYHLDDLLRGSAIYVPPPKPKQEPSSEYKELMARLRREEEARAYERMVNPPLPIETFSQRFPTSQGGTLFPPAVTATESEEDEITYEEVHRQVMLIINILVSIVACGIAIWLISSHWSTPQRLGLSMGGSGIVGVAEVVVYAGYLRKLKEAKKKEAKNKEKKEVMDSWVISAEKKRTKSKGARRADAPPSLMQLADGDKVRRRKIWAK
ncbi:hypothetical protein L228DRAFT_239735 [Xylona heveae TC161]|uniref:Endoplasmic reticulum-based factor for assembly of V-ATPase-domain-containing protein n=1 Tax=Xylona heveae (strain CBS 132557 / TC161) TaxID=1328760 RepID=A0A165G6F5_XYLHT|nr:hypothetical protein L228DRAFT_239735 [Xylona heveae TC161]KZF21793.1 hypothetical protein L228DRAFT_239735 [Xylona heveae TC161]